MVGLLVLGGDAPVKGLGVFLSMIGEWGVRMWGLGLSIPPQRIMCQGILATTVKPQHDGKAGFSGENLDDIDSGNG